MATAEVVVERGEFKNEPFTDFTIGVNRSAMLAALAKVKSQFGREYPLIIGKERITSGKKLSSSNPSRPSEVIGVFSEAGADHANQAMEVAQKAFESWRHVPAADRAGSGGWCTAFITSSRKWWSRVMIGPSSSWKNGAANDRSWS